MHFSDYPQNSTAYLRKALPLMTKLGVPITPCNYAVWYEYVTDSNPMLNHRIDEILRSNDSFTDDLMSDLFNDHVVDISEQKLSKAHHQLESLMSEVGESIHSAGDNMDEYQESLSSCSARLGNSTSSDTLLQVINTITSETREMQLRNMELQKKLTDAQQEAEILRTDLQQARVQAFKDPLTGIANRLGFDHFIQQLQNDVEYHQQPHAFLMLDIDNFKRVNDSHGHLIGDRVIMYVTNAMTNCVKGKDLVARFGGDEMGIFLPNTTADKALIVAEQIRSRLEKGHLIKAGSGEHIGQITISIGIAQLQPGASVEQLLHRADEALYKAKNAGRNQVMLWVQD